MPSGPDRPTRPMPRLGAAAFLLILPFLAVCGTGCPRGDQPPRPPDPAGPAGRVILFGIDGADWQVIDPLVASGRMPNLARVVREGAKGVLLSMEPSASPALWTTIATGVPPERHGIHGFITGEGGGGQPAETAADHQDGGVVGVSGIRPVTSAMRRAPALWNILGSYEKKSGVVGWLVTWPAEPVQGFIVSSYLPYVYNWSTGRPLKGTIVAGIPHQTFPEGLIEQLEGFKVRPVDLDPAVVARFYDRAALPGLTPLDRECVVGFDWSLASDETYRKVARHLFESYPVDLFAVYFGGVDVASHRFWRFAHPREFDGVRPDEVRVLGGVIDAYYSWMDEALGEYLAKLGPRDTLIILSDHGFKAVHIPDQPATSGHHRLEGIIAMTGRGVKPGSRIEGARLVDVVPTVLTLLDVPLARTLEGTVPRGALDEAFAATHGRKRVADYSGAQPPPVDDTTDLDANVLERLRSLGYIR